jgi:pantetheine-phosphate adenylyltransferase
VYTGLTIEACREHGAKFILRGLRNSADFGFERNIAQMNHAMNPGVETVFLVTDPELSAISSTIIREIIKHGGNAKPFVPEGMLD